MPEINPDNFGRNKPNGLIAQISGKLSMESTNQLFIIQHLGVINVLFRKYCGQFNSLNKINAK